MERKRLVKKLIALMLILLMTLMTGCIFDSGGNDNTKDTDDNGGNGGGSGTSQSAETYLPFKTGGTWTFSETSTSYYEGEEDSNTRTYTMTCNGTTTINNITYWEMKVEEDYETFYLRIEGNNVFYYQETYLKQSSRYASKMAKSAQLNELLSKLNGDDERLAFVFNKSAGYTWNISSESGEDYSFTETGKFVGLENVVTSAGTFNNCVHFETTWRSSYTWENQTSNWTETFGTWFAPNVGIVKESSASTQEEETSWESVALLTSYDLDGGGGTGGDGEDEDGLYTISGQVVDLNGAGIAGVLIDATAEIDGEDVYGNDTTDSQGNYLIDRCSNGTWTLTPFSNDYTFSPEYKEVVVSGADVTVSSFTGTSEGD